MRTFRDLNLLPGSVIGFWLLFQERFLIRSKSRALSGISACPSISSGFAYHTHPVGCASQRREWTVGWRSLVGGGGSGSGTWYGTGITLLVLWINTQGASKKRLRAVGFNNTEYMAIQDKIHYHPLRTVKIRSRGEPVIKIFV